MSHGTHIPCSMYVYRWRRQSRCRMKTGRLSSRATSRCVHKQVACTLPCVLQRVAVCVAARCRVCCSALPCVLQRVAVCVAARCLVLQRVARVAARCCSVCCSALQYGLLYVAELQRVAACCNVLQRVAVCAAVRCRVAARCERADCD